MELTELVTDLALAFRADATGPQREGEFTPGIGPFNEPHALALVCKHLVAAEPRYVGTGPTPSNRPGDSRSVAHRSETDQTLRRQRPGCRALVAKPATSVPGQHKCRWRLLQAAGLGPYARTKGSGRFRL